MLRARIVLPRNSPHPKVPQVARGTHGAGKRSAMPARAILPAGASVEIAAAARSSAIPWFTSRTAQPRAIALTPRAAQSHSTRQLPASAHTATERKARAVLFRANHRADSRCACFGAIYQRLDSHARRGLDSEPIRARAPWVLWTSRRQEQQPQQQQETRAGEDGRGVREARRGFRVYAGANSGEERWSLERAGIGLEGSDSNESNSNYYARSDSVGGGLEGEGSKEGVGGEGGEAEAGGDEMRSGQVKKPLNVVLVCPQIPGNTGSIARTCAATAVPLHLVKPLGFDITDSKLKRAGLDYWPYVVVNVHEGWGSFMEYFQQQPEPKRLIAFSKRGSVPHHNIHYQPGDWLLFGAETFGLPPEAITECSARPHAGGVARIPIDETYVRSLNLAVSAGVGVYEALRQIEGHNTHVENEQ
ncbi:hypothetical protein CLOM_g17278 [Closterium sp. NIES-68]|nr:hypothetical protein CLOM_g17278 [Closterium sp. NIES-68]GJP79118.1 hypothetical protein CLOP_g9358 [Closterium sp. NIES-67]